jgi:hypothetical protein
MRLALVSTERLGGEFGATLGATCRENGTAGAGAHADAESVLLGATTVVRLEGALAHSSSPALGSPCRAACNAPTESSVPDRAAVNLLKLGPRGAVVKPGTSRIDRSMGTTDHSANRTVSCFPLDHLCTDTPFTSNTSSGICPNRLDSIPCETSYPQSCTQNLGPLPRSAHRTWRTL